MFEEDGPVVSDVQQVEPLIFSFDLPFFFF